MFICRFCPHKTPLWKSHLDHHHYHKNLSHEFHCGYNGCKERYKVQTRLTTHLYKSHNLSVTQQHLYHIKSNESARYTCKVNLCSYESYNYQSFMKHLKDHISDGVVVKCPASNCSKSYSILSSFTSHLSRAHRSIVSYESPQKRNKNEEIDKITDEINENEVLRVFSGDVCRDEPMLASEGNIDDLFLQNLAVFYLKLESQYTIPVSTIQEIVMNMQNLHDLEQNLMQSKLRNILQKDNIASERIESIIKELSQSNPFALQNSELKNNYRRKQFYHQKLDYVAPRQILIRAQGRKKIFFHYVPIGETLKSLFRNESLKEYLDYSPHHDSEVLRDFTDGILYKNNIFFQKNPDAIKLILYQDGFELVNPIGSAKGKHKIIGVYLSVGNLPSHIRTHINTIQLVALCKEVEFDHEKVYGAIVDDLKILEQDGIEITPGNFRKAGLVFIAGDNLGSHMLGGYLTNFSRANYFCRYCEIRREQFLGELKDCDFCENQGKHYHPQQYQLRTIDSYKENIQRAVTSGKPHFGVKFDSKFNELESYHVASPGLPPCLAHDTIEGIAAYDVPLIINQLVDDKWFTYDQLNSRITNFPWSSDNIRDKPSIVKSDSNKLSGNAWEILTLIRMLPLVIAEHIKDENNDFWNMFLLLSEILEILCAYDIRKSFIPYLQTLINEYLAMRASLFPEKSLRPKHHYLSHYPHLIFLFGPLMQVWTLRFESKHTFFKRVMRAIRNTIHVTKTLSEKHELLQCLLRLGSDIRKEIDIIQSTPFFVDRYCFEIRNAIRWSNLGNSDLEDCRRVVVKGTSYQSGQAVILGQEYYQFNMRIGIIIAILADASKNIHLVVEIADHIFNRTLRVYELKRTSKYDCLPIQGLASYYPLHVYTIGSMPCIRLKHGIVA